MYYTITKATVHQHAAGLLRGCLRLKDFSPTCTAQILLHVLFAASARLCSLSAARWSLATAPSRETIRKALLRSLSARDELLRRLDRALVADVPRGLRKRPQQVAIDLTLVPYHGQPMLDLKEVYRSQARSGTSHFHAYATAYVNYRGQRFTLALTVVERGEKMEEVLKRLLRRLGRFGIGVRMLLLDRGFWGVAVIRYLQAARKPFLMPVILRGRGEDHPEGPGGTRIFATRKKGGWDEYTLTSADGTTARVSICVHCRNYDGQWGRHGRQTLVYAYWKMRPTNTRWVRETYRKRFAIETSYRQMHQGRARTCTRDPLARLLLVGIALVLRNVWVWLHYAILRLLLVGIALVLRNVWVWLHYAILSTPRRGGRRLNLDRLRLSAILADYQGTIVQVALVLHSSPCPKCLRSSARMAENPD